LGTLKIKVKIMIVTITINPALDKSSVVEKLILILRAQLFRREEMLRLYA